MPMNWSQIMIVLFMRNWIRILAVVRVMRTLHVQGAQLAGPRMVRDHRVILSILNMQIRKRTFTHTFDRFEFVGDVQNWILF